MAVGVDVEEVVGVELVSNILGSDFLLEEQVGCPNIIRVSIGLKGKQYTLYLSDQEL